MTPLLLQCPVSILVLYTTYSPETEETKEQMALALRERGHLVRTCRVTHNNWRVGVQMAGDVVINLIEDDVTGWRLWRKVGDHLEMLGRAQVGYGMRSGYISLYKRLFKKRLVEYHLLTPKYRIIEKSQRHIEVKGMEYPLIVKPAATHASEGISQDSVVIDAAELEERVKYLKKKIPGDILVEEYVEGRELHVTVVGNGRHVVALPSAEIDFRGEYADNWDVYTFEAKWKQDTWEYWSSPTVCPTKVSKKMEEKLGKLAVRAFRVLDCVDVVRFDIRLDREGRAYIIDFNVSPDLSCSPDEECWMAANALGWNYGEFMETLVAICYRRVYKRLPDRLRERALLLNA